MTYYTCIIQKTHKTEGPTVVVLPGDLAVQGYFIELKLGSSIKQRWRVEKVLEEIKVDPCVNWPRGPDDSGVRGQIGPDHGNGLGEAPGNIGPTGCPGPIGFVGTTSGPDDKHNLGPTGPSEQQIRDNNLLRGPDGTWSPHR
jgi:hypothetical protein